MPALPSFGQASNAVMTRTFSKLYGLAGLRIGWIYAPDNIVDAMSAFARPSMHRHRRWPPPLRRFVMWRSADMCASTTHVSWSASAVRSRASPECEFISSFANFYLIRFMDGVHTAERAAAALERNGIIPRPVAAGGPEHCLRITVGLVKENDAVLRVLGTYMMS